jgi:glutathione S-transferase
MKLYYHPASTTCRPIMLLAAAENISIEYQSVDLFSGENYQPTFTAINPNQAVPFLIDGEFSLAESSAILKYLADKSQSSTYPTDLQKRARVNERMDWFNTGLYHDLGYGLIYSQVIEAYGYKDHNVQSATLTRARDKAKKWLKILDQNIIGPQNAFVAGEQLTIADYLGACMITLGEVARLDYAAYPNILRWLANMKTLSYWEKANEAFYAQFVGPFKDAPFEGL